MRKVRVFVSSPSDVANERRRLQDIAVSLNGEYVGLVEFEIYRWEDSVYTSDRTFQAQIPPTWDSDIVVSVFWTRLGAPVGAAFKPVRVDGGELPAGLTGSTYELLSALDASRRNAGRPAVYVFRKTEEPVFPISSPQKHEEAWREWQKVGAFLDARFSDPDGHGLSQVKAFGSTDEFEKQVAAVLRDWVEKNVDAASDAQWSERRGTPFPGLAAYDRRHAEVYFGRSRKVANAVRLLREAADRRFPVVFIVGPSGAGKSSLMRAGLATRLTTRGAVDGIDVWRTATMRPGAGASPFHALALALLGAPGEEGALPELRDGPFADPDTLALQLKAGNAAALAPLTSALDAIGRAKRMEEGYERPVGAALLLLVDQFEDLFGNRFSDDDRRAFGRLLEAAGETGRIWIACTLRADLYDRFIGTFIALKDRAVEYSLAPPGESELAEIIEKSAAAAGLTYETNAAGRRLDEELLEHARGADALPLLQFALNSLYEARLRKGSVTLLTYAAYEAFGGIAGAIDSAAEKALAETFGDDPRAFERQLQRLLRAMVVQVVDGRSETVGQEALAVRPVALGALPQDDTTRRLIDALVGARVFVTGSREAGDGDAGARQGTVGIAHERVLESWQRARDFIAREKSYFQVRRNVADQMRLWNEGGRSSAELIRSRVSLDAAVNLTRRYGDELPEDMHAFVRRSMRRARLWTVVYGGVAATLAGLVCVSGYLGWQANRSFVEAQRNYAVARDQVDSLVSEIATRLENTYGIQTAAINAMLAVVERSIDDLRQGNDDPQLERSRGSMYYRFAKIYRKNGRRGGDFQNLAEQKARESFEIRQALAAAWPDDHGMRGDLAFAHELIGDIHRDGRRPADARQAQETALSIREALLAADGADPARRLVMSYSHVRLGDVARDEKNDGEAKAHYLRGLAFTEALSAELPPGHALRGDVLRELTWGLNKLGDMARFGGEWPDAARYYERAACVRDHLARSDADNALADDDLAFSLERLSMVRGRDLVWRHTAAFHALRIRRELARSDPYNANWTYQLAMSLSNIGKLKSEVRQSSAAYAFTFQAHVILRSLAENTSYDDLRFKASLGQVTDALADAFEALKADGVIIREGDTGFIDNVVAMMERPYVDDLEFPACPDIPAITSGVAPDAAGQRL